MLYPISTVILIILIHELIIQFFFSNLDVTETHPLLDNQKKSKTEIPYKNSRMAAGQFLKQLNERKLVVDLFTVFFGVSAWIGVNTLFNELPLLVESSPEQWNLPSYLTVIVQIANIGPISYSILKKYLSVSDKYTIYLIITIGALSALSMAFFYSQTTIIFGVEHSTALFVLMFFTALVGCTSSVLFMPYMGRYLEIYLITYLMGEGLSGFIASMVAIVQGKL